LAKSEGRDRNKEKELEKEEDQENANVQEGAEAAPQNEAEASDPTSDTAATSAEEEVQPPPVVEEEKDKVTLFQVPRGYFTPSASPFGLRLETFLRVAGIEHEVEIQTSNSNSTPWIKVGDDIVRNHDDIIPYLVKKFNVKLDAQASGSRKTAARLVDTLFETKISWGVALWRWVYDEGKSVKDIQYLPPKEKDLLVIRDSIQQSARYQGMGRRSKEDVVQIVSQGLADAAGALGKHPYFLGDSPGEVDCRAFSILAQMVWNMPSSPFETSVKQIKPLMDYVIRVRETFYPDWEQLIMQSPGQANNDAEENADKTFERDAMPSPSPGMERMSSAVNNANNFSVDPNSNIIQNPAHPSLAATQIPQPVFGQQRVPVQQIPRHFQGAPQMQQRQGYHAHSNIPVPIANRFAQYTMPMQVGAAGLPFVHVNQGQRQQQNVYGQHPQDVLAQTQAHMASLQRAADALTRPRTPANPAQNNNSGVGYWSQ